MKECKAKEYNVCNGKGTILNNKKSNFCTKQCHQNFIQARKIATGIGNRSQLEKHIKLKNEELDEELDELLDSILTSFGCTLFCNEDPIRCKKYQTCKNANQCLTLAWNLKGKGFTSDGKGYSPINSFNNKNNGWAVNGDYTCEYRINSININFIN